MKTPHITTAIVAALLIGALMYAAISTAPYRPVYRASYLLDRTDTFQLNPTAMRTEHQFSWNRLKQERNVRIRKVTDVVSEDITILSLPPFGDFRNPASWDFADNEVFRENKVRKMEVELATTLARLATEQTGYHHSAIMEPLVDELIHLQAYPHDDRELFLYSDMGQNTISHNWIKREATTNQLAANDTTLWSVIEGVSDLTDLIGIRIHIIHRPKTAEEDVVYRIRANYVKTQLTKLGAIVSIHGGVNHNGK